MEGKEDGREGRKEYKREREKLEEGKSFRRHRYRIEDRRGGE